jgi:hypothetical protein
MILLIKTQKTTKVVLKTTSIVFDGKTFMTIKMIFRWPSLE